MDRTADEKMYSHRVVIEEENELITNLAESLFPVYQYLANFGFECRDMSFFVNQPKFVGRGRHRRRNLPNSPICSIFSKLLVSVLLICFLCFWAFGFTIRNLTSIDPGYLIFKITQCLQAMAIFFSLFFYHSKHIAYAKKLQQIPVEADQAKKIRRCVAPLGFIVIILYLINIGYGYYSIMHLTYGLAISFFINILVDMTYLLSPYICAYICGIAIYVTTRIDSKITQIRQEKHPKEKAKLFNYLVNNEYHTLKQLVAEADQILTPTVEVLRMVFIAFTIICVSMLSNCQILNGIYECRLMFICIVELLVYEAAIAKVNKKKQDILKVVCEMLVDEDMYYQLPLLLDETELSSVDAISESDILRGSMMQLTNLIGMQKDKDLFSKKSFYASGNEPFENVNIFCRLLEWIRLA